MTGHGEKLSRKREQAISALLVAPTVGDAAEVVGVGARTLHRWLKDPSFRADYLAARRAVVSHTTSALQQASSLAVHTLVDVMGDENAPSSSRVAAARAVVDLSYRGVELEDLSFRVDCLEGTVVSSEQVK